MTVALAVVGRIVFARPGPRIAANAAAILGASVAGVLLGRLVAREPLTDMVAVGGGVLRWTAVGCAIAVIYYTGFYAELAANRADAAKRRQAELAGLARRTELEVLQRQIEPDFLLSALTTARGLYRDDPERAAALLGSLAAYLRPGEGGGVLTTLGRELELVEAYLGVCAARMGERLKVAVEVAPELRDAEVPPLSVAALVENAVIHGLEPQPGGGTLTIRAGGQDGRLEMLVEDDGRGLGETPGAGFGLANTRTRLAALYGADAGLDVAGRAQGGVAARLWLPLARAA